MDHKEDKDYGVRYCKRKSEGEKKRGRRREFSLEPEAISNIVSVVLKRDGGRGILYLFRIREIWKEVIPEPLNYHLVPKDIKGKVLIIGVDSSSWLGEAPFYKEEILKRLEQAGIKVEGIKFFYNKKRYKTQYPDYFKPYLPPKKVSELPQVILKALNSLKDERLTTVISNAITYLGFEDKTSKTQNH